MERAKQALIIWVVAAWQGLGCGVFLRLNTPEKTNIQKVARILQ